MASNYSSAGSHQDGESDGDNQTSSDRGHADPQEVCTFSESESDFSDSDSDSGSESQQGALTSQSAPKEIQACKYYNQGRCKDGKKCQYEHVCQYFLKGMCRYGSNCHLRHVRKCGPESSAGQSRSRGERRRRSSSEENEADDGRPYSWQINSGDGWKNIANDHIIEAQYSQPSARGIKLYNTHFGVISIDFKKMKVLKKTGLRVRRWNSSRPGQETEWVWYCSRKHGWMQYGEKDSSGKTVPVKSSRIETEFQKNPMGSLKFTIDTIDYRVNFRGMCQENLASGRKRDVARRPRFKMTQNSARNVIPPLQRLSVSSPTWEFKGDSGKWYIFKPRRGTDTESSVSSADIEAQFQLDRRGSMNFTVSGQRYTLDFSDMTQTNLTSQMRRRVRRVSS